MKLPVGLFGFWKRKESIGSCEEENDRCIMCWCPTEYKRSAPVALRKHYVNGLGQMCEGCYLQLQKNNAAEEGTEP